MLHAVPWKWQMLLFCKPNLGLLDWTFQCRPIISLPHGACTFNVSFSCHDAILCDKGTHEQQLLAWSYTKLALIQWYLHSKSGLKNYRLGRMFVSPHSITGGAEFFHIFKTILLMQNQSDMNHPVNQSFFQFSNDSLADQIFYSTQSNNQLNGLINWLWLDHRLMWGKYIVWPVVKSRRQVRQMKNGGSAKTILFCSLCWGIGSCLLTV